MSQISKIEDLPLNWEEEVEPAETEIICGVENDDDDCVIFESASESANANGNFHQRANNSNIIYTDDVANDSSVIYMPEDQTSQGGFANEQEVVASNSHQVVQYQFPDQEYLDIQVTEEVVSEAWGNGQEGVGDSLTLPNDVKLVLNQIWEDEVEIPLPQDQDSYAASRPYPCDFCSRRFSKKANLMNHMVCHQVERPHLCNLCGVRYRRKAELITHMKIHAFAPGKGTVSDEDDDDDDDNEDGVSIAIEHKKRTKNKSSKRGRKSLNHHAKYNNNENFMNNKSPKYSKKNSYTTSYRAEKYEVEDPLKAISDLPLQPRWPITDPTRPYVCQHCGVGFAREKALISHSRIHAGDSPFECNTCGEMFWDITMLRNHAHLKHGIRLPNNIQEIDGNEQPEYYQNDDNNSEELNDFHCDMCGNVFHRYDLLKRHKRLHLKVESGDSVFNCDLCEENFSNQEDLFAHVESHPGHHSHRCMLCGECFLDSATLAQHVRRRHAKELPAHTCTLCGKTCKDKRSLQKHLWIHSADKSYTCSTCGKRFHSRPRLKRHMMSHRDKMVACDECGKEFPDGRALINHRHSHNKDHTSRQFHCYECDKSFGSRSSQQIHARIHTGERPYGCRFCWKAFADGGTLRKHERIHTGEKPYACPICPRAFNQRVVLREHIRSHHSGPEMSSGTHSPIYVCKVCSGTFTRSDELCLHLIAHSDENTAKHRMTRIGPRKYKRRRRLNAHELRLFSESLEQEQDDAYPNDFAESYANNDREEELDDSDEDYGKRKITKRKYNKSRSSRHHVSDNFESVVKSFESVMENFNSIVDSSKSDARKAKMKRKYHRMKKNEEPPPPPPAPPPPRSPSPPMSPLHQQHQQQPQQGLASGGFVKSNRPMGEGRIRPRTKNVTLSTLAALKAVNVISPGDPASADLIIRGGPRTKNVNYHNVKMVKLEPATFDDYKPILSTLLTTTSPAPSPPLETETSATTYEPPHIQFVGKVEVEDTTEVEVTTEEHHPLAEDKRPLTPIEDNPITDEIVNSFKNVHSKKHKNKQSKSKKLEAATTTEIDSSIVKLEYKCEMCSETFTKRSDLLIHVPIHI